MTRGIHWFRRDLRLRDNRALDGLADRVDAFLPVFVVDPRLVTSEMRERPRVRFLFDCLERLGAELAERGLPLVVRSGLPERVIPALMKESGASLLSFGTGASPFALRRDERVAKAVARQGGDVLERQDDVVQADGRLRSQSGDAYRVYTPYRNAWWQRFEADPPLPGTASRLPPAIPGFEADRAPTLVDRPLEETRIGLPTGGERAARRRLMSFLETGVLRYADDRDRPDVDGTSRLSPYLRFGIISARQCVPPRARPGAPGPRCERESRSGSTSSSGGSSTSTCSREPTAAAAELAAGVRRDGVEPRSRGAGGLGRGTNRLSDRRRRHATAAPDRLDAQPRSHDRRQLPDEGSAHRLAGRRTRVPRPAGRRRSRLERGRLAVGRVHGQPTRSPGFASSTRSPRAGGTIPRAATCGNSCRSSADAPRGVPRALGLSCPALLSCAHRRSCREAALALERFGSVRAGWRSDEPAAVRRARSRGSRELGFRPRSDRPIRLGVSSCLLGNPVRFDGGHKHDRFVTDGLGAFVEWVSVCPELEAGLGVPRPAMRLVEGRPEGRSRGDGGRGERRGDGRRRPARRDRRRARPHRRHAALHRASVPGAARARAVRLRAEEGLAELRHGAGQRVPGRRRHAEHDGRGIFAQALREAFPRLPIEEEGRLNDPVLRENFIERVFAYRRLQRPVPGALDEWAGGGASTRRTSCSSWPIRRRPIARSAVSSPRSSRSRERSSASTTARVHAGD